MTKGINSKNKGNRAERELSLLLGHITGVKWHRVPCSGALFTCNNTLPYKGDVYCNEELYSDVVIECKHYKRPVTIFDLFNPKSNFNEWFKQLSLESKGYDGFLFFKNQGKWFWVRSGLGRNSVSTSYKFIGLLNKSSVKRHSFSMLTLSLSDIKKSNLIKVEVSV